MRPLRFLPENQVTLLHGGAGFFPSLIAAIDEARDAIFLETYIFASDETGLEVRDALHRAADRGVRVHVINDWTGTGRAHTERLQKELEKEGVQHRVFNPWFRRGIARSHRKLCVIDDRIAFVGGINIIDDMQADDDSDIRLPSPRWDFAVRIEGPLVAPIHLEMEAQWYRLGSLKLRSRWELFRDKTPLIPSGYAPMLAAFVVENMSELPELPRLLYVAQFELHGADRMFREHLGPIFDAVNAYFSRCAAKGLIRDLDPTIATLGLAGAVGAHLNLHQLFTGQDVPWDARNAAPAYAEFWLNALQQRPPQG